MGTKFEFDKKSQISVGARPSPSVRFSLRFPALSTVAVMTRIPRVKMITSPMTAATAILKVNLSLTLMQS